ncbi:hypothetical protein [Lactococcus cremoris]|uniref:hypothetical protein n=1 Tax=Lactococcus lactis subsp. cremoris TaxID=1359 RepID=UPI000583635D|nr:hypothetical protein [Lactococcus cremoris]KGH33027.1 hypothetical protein JL36_10085 [Lactococcus cremoris]
MIKKKLVRAVETYKNVTQNNNMIDDRYNLEIKTGLSTNQKYQYKLVLSKNEDEIITGRYNSI